MTQFSVSSQVQQNSKVQFGSALMSLISAGFSKRLQSHIHLQPSCGRNYSLDNSDAWFDRVISIPDTRKWIETAALSGHKIYIIVGFQTFTDTRIVQKSARGQQAGGKIHVPVNLFLAAATAVMPSAELVDPAVHGEHRHIESDQLCLLARGEQWSCTEGDRRDAYEDSDEDDEDIIEVDLGNAEEFDGEWDVEDFARGTIYLQSNPDECHLPA
ncbi:hypothetical protein LEL_06803 [Akanthomyces lecanii RCEF 1005]|uniref:Uncharacterized protein n=1 Tax=Akanthomyces lecanii RCEF 1005 TaxID=1081108 RepID=A0A168F8L0_CORDF|nr:hypothetical protein LEL_06803 [Akanthomyces lecanii RCEF 1005]